MANLEYFLEKARKISWLGVEFILKGGFPKGKWIPFSDLHRGIQETIDKVKKEVEAVKLGLLDSNKAKRGALIQISRDHSKCCVEGTLITLENGLQKPIEECQIGDKVLAINEDLHFVPAKVVDVVDNGIKSVYRVKLDNGMCVEVTSNHSFFTSSGWKSIDSGLKIGDNVAVSSDNFKCSKVLNEYVCWSKIVDIEFVGKKQTYGLEVDKYHNHITNGIVTHNTTSVLGRVLWELGNNPNLLIKIVCASEEQAKKRIAFLRRHIETNKNLHLLFPHLKPQPDSAWSTTQLYVERSLISPDPSVEAAGVLGSFTGSHCVVEGTLVITSEGLKPIEKVRVGDFVYSITGRFERVIATAKHFYKGKIYCVKSASQGFVPVKITSDHKILVAYVEDNIPKMEWLKVEEVAKEPKKYFLAFPKPDFTEICKISSSEEKQGMFDNFHYVSIAGIEEGNYEGIVYDLQVSNGHSFCSPFITLMNCNLLVFDDIIDFRNAFVYPENLKKIEQAVKENWLNILSEDGYFVAIYTAWTKDDVTLKMEKQSDLYYVYKRVIDDDLNPIWEAKYNREALLKKREEIGEEAFARQFQGKIVVNRSNLFNKRSIEACKDPNIEFGEYPDNCLFFTGVDLGHRKKDKSPRTVIFTLAVTEDGKRLPVSIIAGNFSPTETGQLIINEFLKYHPEVIKVENNGYQESILDIISLIDPSLSLPVEGCFTGSQKNDIRVGLPSLATEFDRKLWIIPAKNLDQHPQNCDCGLCLWLKELESYPQGLTDTVMASWFALQGVRQVLGTDTAYNVRVIEYSEEEGEININ